MCDFKKINDIFPLIKEYLIETPDFFGSLLINLFVVYYRFLYLLK